MAEPTRIKISINGISSGSLLKIGESVGITSKEALIAEAARRLLPEAGAKAVDPAAGELYLDGGFDVPTLNELDKDDHGTRSGRLDHRESGHTKYARFV